MQGLATVYDPTLSVEDVGEEAWEFLSRLLVCETCEVAVVADVDYARSG